MGNGERKSGGTGARADRLAAALRANLKRRKAQSRARRGGAGVGVPGEDAGAETATDSSAAGAACTKTPDRCPDVDKTGRESRDKE